MQLTVTVQDKSYLIRIERGLLGKVASYLPSARKVMVISDDGVPQSYVDLVLAGCPNGYAEIVKAGEGAKSLAVYEQICAKLLALGFGRKDTVVAVGGGVVGDLAGFVAATYLRGVPFINIPTTTLSQIDSSIGGKVAVNLSGVKNILGAFYQPQAVFIDPDTLATLPARHFNNGLAEAVKAALIYDADLFALLEQADCQAHIEEIIYRSLSVKKAVVEADEKEENVRRLLNFGHTVGHGLESVYGLRELLHGEAVAIGMLAMIDDPQIRARLAKVYAKLSLPADIGYDPEAVFALMRKDKKAEGTQIAIVKLHEIGRAYVQTIPLAALRDYLKGGRVI